MTVADDIRRLAARLVDVLRVPPQDPFDPEWIAVPTAAMRRWLGLEVARHLGASGAHADGVAANIRFEFPGVLPRLVYEAGQSGESRASRWRSEELPWAVLEALVANSNDPRLALVASDAHRATAYGRARQIAELFDRYHTHRPAMIRRWASGDDLDAAGARLAAGQQWQPHLWRAVREHVGVPAPPEVMPKYLEAVGNGELALDLPERLSVFGLSNLPGGAAYLEVLDSIAAQRDLHVMVLAPSLSAGRWAVDAFGKPGSNLLRAEVDFDDPDRNSLGRSWGQLNLETLALAGAAGCRPGLAPHPPPEPSHSRPKSLLASLQAAVRDDQPFDALPPEVVSSGDSSVQFHACPGRTRQVEVLRDVILHLLEADPTLSEDDIVVVCPAIERFAPTIEAVLARSAGLHEPLGGATPRLRYRITDRSLRSVNPILAAIDVLLDMPTGRFEATAVLDLLSVPALRHRFGLGEEDVARIVEWVERTTVRWGLDAPSREPFGLPAAVDGFTWQRGVDRLLLGAAVLSEEDSGGVSIGGLLPLGVEGDEVRIVGRLAQILHQLRELATEADRPRPVGEWMELVADVVESLFAVGPDDRWQISAAHRVPAELVATASVDDVPSDVPLSFDEVRMVLRERLGGTPGRPDHYRGGITFTSLRPMGWLPHRVVCLLGMDEAALVSGSSDGDDLLALAAAVGDRDPRAELRQSLLSMLLAAEDHLIVIRDGRDVRTNQEIPAAVAVAELRDAIVGLVPEAQRDEFARCVEVHHPRQAYDQRCFEPGALGAAGPWSFDVDSLKCARVRAVAGSEHRPFLDSPLILAESDVVQLDDLIAVLRNPPEAFVERSLDAKMPTNSDAVSSLLPVTFSGLAQWESGDRLLRALLDGAGVEEWREGEIRRGALPPGCLGEAALVDLESEVRDLLLAYEAYSPSADEQTHDLEVTLPDGTRVVGVVGCALPQGSGTGERAGTGPASIRFVRPKDVESLGGQLELMMLVAAHPDEPWRALSVRRGAGSSKKPTVRCFGPAVTLEQGALQRQRGAVAVLEVAVDAYRRSLREPIPLFPRLSPELNRGRVAWREWHGGEMPNGDLNDPATALTYGAFDYEALLRLPALKHDPEGPEASRAKRYAKWFWGTIGASTRDLAAEGEAS